MHSNNSDSYAVFSQGWKVCTFTQTSPYKFVMWTFSLTILLCNNLFQTSVCWGIWNSSMKNLLDRSMHYYRFAPGFDFEFLSLTSRMNLLLWISNPQNFNSRNKPTFLPNLFTCGSGSNGFYSWLVLDWGRGVGHLVIMVPSLWEK